jgi:hypothetical protein
VSGEYWTVRMPGGSQARLGYNADSEQLTNNACNPTSQRTCHISGSGDQLPLGYRGRDATGAPNPAVTARSWRVDLITDTLGNSMIFNYAKLNNGPNSTDSRVTLRNIYYNNSGGSYLTHIALVGTDNPADGEPTIDHIDISNTNASGVQVLVRKYLLTRTPYTKHYNHCWGGDPADTAYTALTGFQQQDGNNVSLPAQGYVYVWQPTAPDCMDLMQLSNVNNGYGGSSAIAYQATSGYQNYTVQNIQTTDGVGASAAMYSTHAYGTPCFDYYGSLCASRSSTLCGADCGNGSARNLALAGFDVVTQTQWNGATVINQTVHYFYNADPYWQVGKEYRTRTYDGGGALLTENNNTYSTIPINGTTFAYVGQSDATTYSGGTALTKRTDYTYG